MNSHLKLTEVVLSLAIILLVFELVRRGRLERRYSIGWFIFGFTVLLFALSEGLLTRLGGALGVAYPPSTVFGGAFLLSVLLFLHFSAVLSRVGLQTVGIAQELAMLRLELDKLQAEAQEDGDGT
jgi:hypothetical protein